MTQTPHPVDQHVGKRLRRIRREAKVKQPELAAFIGVSPQLIQRYEVGETRICASRLYDLAEALEVEITDFFAELDPEIDAGAPPSLVADIAEPVRLEVLERSETKELVAAFAGISNAKARQKILELARALGGSAD